MKIGIIGAKGFIGQEIYNHLEGHELYCIPGDTPGKHYDVVIDANGSSKKYLAEEDSLTDFRLSVDPVLNHVHRVRYDKYIYISSIDAELPRLSNYGFNRSIAEQVVMKYANNWTIIRLCSVIGSQATKGIVHDILNNKKLFVQKESVIQVIPVSTVAENIRGMFYKYDYQILKFYSNGGISINRICNMFGKNPDVDVNAKIQYYDEAAELGFKTAEQYLKETFYERVV